MHEYGTTSEQLAWVKVAASHHAQHNPHAMLREVVTVKDVLDSPIIADPLHRLDCCVVSDGGGAVIVARAGNRAAPAAPRVTIVGTGESTKGWTAAGRSDLVRGAVSGRIGVQGGRRNAGGHQVRVDLRQFHDHRHRAARGPRLLREGRGRPIRRRRQPDLRHRQAAIQHRRRRSVQQPSREPRRHDQGDRSGAPAARRGASEGAGRGTATLRSRRAPAASSPRGTEARR